MLNDIRYCLEIWGTDYEKIKQTCILAEELGYYGFYYGESLTEIDLDCWTVLSTLIPITNKIRLGPVITYMLPDYRSLALLVKQSITFQDISKGRLEFRTGPGASLEYSLQWWYPFGINYSNAIKRVAMFNEGIQLLSKFLRSSDKDYEQQSGGMLVTNFNGQFYKIHGASFIKPKIRIPITIAAKQDRMMKIAATYADIWECSYLTPDEYSTLNKKFEILFNAQNSKKSKDPQSKEIRRSIELDVLIANTEQELDYRKKIFAMERGPGVYNQILRKGLVGSPTEVRTRIQEYVDLGINQFFLAFQDPFDHKSIELFMNTVKN